MKKLITLIIIASFAIQSTGADHISMAISHKPLTISQLRPMAYKTALGSFQSPSSGIDKTPQESRHESAAKKPPPLLFAKITWLIIGLLAVYFLATSSLSTVLVKKVLIQNLVNPLGYIITLFVGSNAIGFIVKIYQEGFSFGLQTPKEKISKLIRQWNLTDEEYRVFSSELTPKDRLVIFLNALQGQTVGTILFITAMSTVLPPGLYALFFTTRSVLALVMGHWILGHKMNVKSERVQWRRNALGLTLVFGGLLAGMALTSSGAEASSINLGIMVTAILIVLAAAQVILQRYILRVRYGKRPEIQPTLRMIMVKYGYLQGLALCTVLFTLLGLLPSLWPAPGRIASEIFSQGFPGFIQLNIWIPVLSFIYFTRWNIVYYLQGHARIVTAVLVPTLVPVMTWALSTMVFGQSLGTAQIIAGIVVLFGVAKIGASNLLQDRQERADANQAQGSSDKDERSVADVDTAGANVVKAKENSRTQRDPLRDGLKGKDGGDKARSSSSDDGNIINTPRGAPEFSNWLANQVRIDTAIAAAA
ncbi:MAG: DMT family transporter [Candidatus Omnitrophica bacterium]|nr:DMT family transporter [Candidatus Omnitrophota bacterium]